MPLQAHPCIVLLAVEGLALRACTVSFVVLRVLCGETHWQSCVR